MSHLSIKQVEVTHPDFEALVEKLDAYLAFMDGEEHSFYNQFNSPQKVPYKHILVGYTGEIAVACGAIKAYNSSEIEIKRMFVLPEMRGKGYAAQMLSALENWAKELGYAACILETGKRQVEAVKLYQKSGYQLIPNYPPYEGVENSLCMRKEI